jgi:RNA polymerase sigma-70 factor (ECF subfamily)
VAITLVHHQELTNIEAAEVMDISNDALESLLSRGRRKLKELLIDRKNGLVGGV